MQITGTAQFFTVGARASVQAETALAKANEEETARQNAAQSTATPAPPPSHAHKRATAELARLLNMASPDSYAAGVRLFAPHMALTPKREPGSDQTRVLDIKPEYTGPVRFDPEGRAEAIIEHLGGGDDLSLAEAKAAFLVPNPGKLTNKAETVASYFTRVDSDKSGTLNQQELVKLMEFYDRENIKNVPHGPKLPSTWI